MGKLSRTKGHSYEREVARDLRETGNFPDAKRKLEYQESECIGIDIENAGSLDIQCKRLKKYAPITKIEEIHPMQGRIPVLVTKADHKRSVACLYWEDFLEILKDIGVVYQGKD